MVDTRFFNEIAEIKSWGGHPIWIDASKRITPDYTHPSEPKAEEFIPLVDYVLDNNGDLSHLGLGVKGMLKFLNKMK